MASILSGSTPSAATFSISSRTSRSNVSAWTLSLPSIPQQNTISRIDSSSPHRGEGAVPSEVVSRYCIRGEALFSMSTEDTSCDSSMAVRSALSPSFQPITRWVFLSPLSSGSTAKGCVAARGAAKGASSSTSILRSSASNRCNTADSNLIWWASAGMSPKVKKIALLGW